MKSMKSMDMTRWQFPGESKTKPLYPPKRFINKKINQIFAQLEDKYSSNYLKNKLASRQKLPAEKSPTETKDNKEICAPKESILEDSLQQEIENNLRKDSVLDPPESEMKPVEKESSFEINILEQKYFRRWYNITKRRLHARGVIFRKDLFQSFMLNQVNLETELWRRWKNIEGEIAEMKKILFLNWIPFSNINYSFEYSRYVKEYMRNPLKWMDSKHITQSGNLEVKSTRRWIKLNEANDKLKSHFLRECIFLQDSKYDELDLLYMQKQEERFNDIKNKVIKN